jgi:hypothetical protein
MTATVSHVAWVGDKINPADGGTRTDGEDGGSDGADGTAAKGDVWAGGAGVGSAGGFSKNASKSLRSKIGGAAAPPNGGG